MRKVLPFFLVFLGVVFCLRQGTVEAAIVDHVVISEIQIGDTNDADNEFIELYNPTNVAVDLTGWRLKIGASSNLVANMSGTIKSHGYFLVANPAYITIPVIADTTYSATSSAISSNSYVTLLKKVDNSLVIEDLVGMGTAGQFEGAVVMAPGVGKSIERKSDEGGVIEEQGNGWDTDVNAADFVIRDVPEPQNSNSSTEPAVSPTPEVPTPTVEVSPTPTTEPTPTVVPPTPTVEPSPTNMPPIPTIEPSPTSVPPIPTAEPSPTVVIPSPTSGPTPTPILTPPPTQTIVTPLLTCSISYKKKSVMMFSYWFPQLICTHTKSG